MMTSLSESVSLPPSIVSLHRASPVRLQLGSASVISVQVQGHPSPRVSWFVGKNRVQPTSPDFRTEVEGQGRRHNLRIKRVTRELGEGVAVEARSEAGRDFQTIAIAICQDEPVEDDPMRTSSTLASSNGGAFEHISGFDGELPVAGRSTCSFTEDVFDDEVISPGIPPLLLVRQKETVFPDDTSMESLSPTGEGSIPNPTATSKAQGKNLRTKSKSGRSNNQNVHSALQGPTEDEAANEVWKLHEVSVESVYRNLLRDSVPSIDDMDQLVSHNENWKPIRRSSSYRDAAANSEAEEKLRHNERSTLQQPLTAINTQDTNTKKTSRLSKLKDRIKKIKRLSGKKQNKDDNDSSFNTDRQSNENLESEIMSVQDEIPMSSSSGKAPANKKIPRQKTSITVKNGRAVEVILPYSAYASNSEVFPANNRISTDIRQTSLGHENSTGYTIKNGLSKQQNDLVGSGDLSPAGYSVSTISAENATEYKMSQSKERDSRNGSNEIVIADKNRLEFSQTGRKIEFQTRGFPPIQLLLKKDDPEVIEASDNIELFDETRINLSCSSPPADEVERFRHRLSSSQSQDKSSTDRLHQRVSDSHTRPGSYSHGGARYSSSGDDLDADRCVVASPTSPVERGPKKSDDGSSKREPEKTQSQGWVVARRSRAEPMPRSRSCQRTSTAERRSWIENARSVEIHVPRRSRSTSRTRWRSLNKEWDLVTVTTTTEETRTLPNAHAAVAAAHTNTAVVTANESRVPENTERATNALNTATIEGTNTTANRIYADSTTSAHQERATYRATLSSVDKSNSSFDSNSTDAGEYVLRSGPNAGLVEEKIHGSSTSQPKSTATPRRSRKDNSFDSSTGKISSNDGPKNKNSSFDFAETSSLDSKRINKPDRSAVTYDTKAKVDISAANRSQSRSMKVKNSESGKVEDLLEAKENRGVITQPYSDTGSVELNSDVNETGPETLELKFKITDVNSDVRMPKTIYSVTETGSDFNFGIKEVSQKTHLVEINRKVGYDKETIEGKRKLDKVSPKPKLVQSNHDVDRNDAKVQSSKTRPSEVNRDIDHNTKRVELNLELPEGENLVELSGNDETRLNEAVDRLNAEMIGFNKNKTHVSSEFVEPSDRTMAVDSVEELPDGLSRSILVTDQQNVLGLTDQSDSFQVEGQRDTVPLGSDVREGNERFSFERFELNHDAAQLNRAMTRLSAEMVELNSDIPAERIVSANPETCEVSIALPKRNSSSKGYNIVSTRAPNSSPILTTEYSLSEPHEKTHNEGNNTSLHISVSREQPNVASEYGKDWQKKDKTLKDTGSKRISDSESTNADDTQLTDDSVFERDDVQVGKLEIWTNADGGLSTDEEAVTPIVMSEFAHNVMNADDADMANSLTTVVKLDVTKSQESDDAMDSMTTEVMSGVSEGNDDTDTMESLTTYVMPEDNVTVKHAVSRASQRNLSTDIRESSKGTTQRVTEPSNVLKSKQTTAEDNIKLDGRPDSRSSREALSQEETDEDSYAIVDDNWKASLDARHSITDGLRTEEAADTCEEDDTSMAVEKILEYKQVEDDALETTRSRTPCLDKRGSANINATSARPLHVSTAIDTSNAYQDTIVSQFTSEVQTLSTENDTKLNNTKLNDSKLNDSKLNDTKLNSQLLLDNGEKNSDTVSHSGFPEADDDDQVDVHDYFTYIRSVFGTRSLSNSVDDRGSDAGNSEDFSTSSDPTGLFEAAKIHRSRAKVTNLGRYAAFDTQDLTNIELDRTGPENIEGTAGSFKSKAETLVDPTENYVALHFKVPEDPQPVRGERKISVSSLVLKRPPDVRSVTVEERAIGLIATHPLVATSQSAASNTDSTAHRSELQTEVRRIPPISRSITLPSSGTPQSRGASTSRLTSQAEIVINSLGIESSKASDVQLRRTRPTRASLTETSLQIQKDYALEASPNRTSLSGIKFRTEKSHVIEGPRLARPTRKSLSEIRLQTEKSFFIEGLQPVRPNRTSQSEIRFQVEKDYALEESHLLSKPNQTSLAEIKFKTKQNYVPEKPITSKPRPTSVSEIKIQKEKDYALEELQRSKPNNTSRSEIKLQTKQNYAPETSDISKRNPTSLSEIMVQKEKDYALEDLHRSKSNHTSRSEIKLQTKQNFASENLHPARTDPASLAELNVQTQKNYALEDLQLSKPNHTSRSEIRLQTKQNNVLRDLTRSDLTSFSSEIKIQREKIHVVDDLTLSKSNPNSLSEIQIQTEKDYVLEGPSQAAVATPAPDQIFRTILTIIGQSSDSASSISKEQVREKYDKFISVLNKPRNEVTKLTIPTGITVLLSANDEIDSSITSTDETYTAEQKLPYSRYNEAGEAPQSEEDDKVPLHSESVKWTPSKRGSKEDTADDDIHLEISDSSKTTKVRIQDMEISDEETVADSKREYNMASLGPNQLEQSSEKADDSGESGELWAVSRTMNAKDLGVGDNVFQKDIENVDTQYEFESKEMTSEMTDDDGIHFNRAVIVTSVESEKETDSDGDKHEKSWKEESVDLNKEKWEERESDVNVTEVIHDSESEYNDEIPDELTAEVRNNFDNAIIVESNGESQSGIADRTSWKEEETMEMKLGEEEKVHTENEIEKYQVESRVDQITVVSDIETEIEVESGKADSIAWKEDEILFSPKDEETERSRCVDTAEANYESEPTDELMIEDENHFDRSAVAEMDTIIWKERYISDVLKNEETEKSRYVDTAEANYEPEIIDELIIKDEGHFENALLVTNIEIEEEEEMKRNVDLIEVDDENQKPGHLEVTAEDESHEFKEGEQESGDVENSDKAEQLSWNEEEKVDDVLADGEEINKNTDISEGHEDELIDEWVEERGGKFDRDMVVTCVEEAEDEDSQSGNGEVISWKYEDTLTDEEEVLKEDITEEQHENEKHPDVQGEVILEDQSNFDQVTVVENDVEIENEKEDTIRWKAEETLDVREDEEIEKLGSVYTADAQYRKEITDDLIVEDRGQFDHSDEIAWKAEETLDVLEEKEVEESRYFNNNDILDELITEYGGDFDHTTVLSSVETKGESLSADEEKFDAIEGESEYTLRDQEEERSLSVTEQHSDNELVEYNETIRDGNLEDESYFDEYTVYSKIKTEGGSESEGMNTASCKAEETIETNQDEETYSQLSQNPKSVAADLSDSIEFGETTERGTFEEDTHFDYKATYDSESNDNDALQIEHSSETEHQETLVRPKEQSTPKQSAGDHQTIRSTEGSVDYEARSKELSERIWKMLEGQGLGKREDSHDTQAHDPPPPTESKIPEEYLESSSQSLSEKRWQEIELLRKASDEALAKARKTSTERAEKGFDFETWHRGFNERKSQAINLTKKPGYPEVDVETTSRSLNERNVQTLSEFETTTDSQEKQKHPEVTAEEEYESFSEGLHEEGWRTYTLNEQASANANSEIVQTDCADRGESKSDNDYMVTYEYGEMYSVFHHLPFSIETLRESVMENFNSSPTMKRLLNRYPSLRPGTWKWSSTFRDIPSQRPWDVTAAAAQDTRIKEVQHLETVSVADQFTPNLMTEKFNIV